MALTIQELQEQAFKTADEKGFHKVFATFGDRMALIHTEVSEAMEAFREDDNDSTDALRHPLYQSAITGHKTSFPYEYIGNTSDGTSVPNKPIGVWSELADIVIRVADCCGVYGINLEEAIQRKLAYNRTRPYLHGGKKL